MWIIFNGSSNKKDWCVYASTWEVLKIDETAGSGGVSVYQYTSVSSPWAECQLIDAISTRSFIIQGFVSVCMLYCYIYEKILMN